MSNNGHSRFHIYVDGQRKTFRSKTATEVDSILHRWRTGKYYGRRIEVKPANANNRGN